MPSRNHTEQLDFPPDCCGCCGFFHLIEDDTYCFSLPPFQIYDPDQGVLFMRGGNADPTDPACIHFKPKHHA